MKTMNISTWVLALGLATCSLGLTSCGDDDIALEPVNESPYTLSDGAVAYLVDGANKRDFNVVEFRTEGTSDLFVSTTTPVSAAVTLQLNYQADALTQFNQTHGTDYELFPENLVTIPATVELAKGAKQSSAIAVSVKTDAALETGKTYAIPVHLSANNAVVKATAEGDYMILVRDLTALPDANKSTGIQIISCMEANNTNPLNNMIYTLKGSGKQLIDQVILFSSNINYNVETGRVYIFHNNNIQHMLDNREKYIKPLQDRGIKVLLSILGNHDQAGVANLSKETAKYVAQEIKANCDAYGLDGVFFDDEYSSYPNPIPPGFVSPSSAGAARLIYESKKAMPDKLVEVYVWSTTSSLPSVDGEEPGQWMDYALQDYGRGGDLSGNYPGLPKSGMAQLSSEYAQGRFCSESGLQSIRNDGYGAHMIFAMDPYRSNSARQRSHLETIARTLYDDELVVGEPFPKDW